MVRKLILGSDAGSRCIPRRDARIRTDRKATYHNIRIACANSGTRRIGRWVLWADIEAVTSVAFRVSAFAGREIRTDMRN